MQAAQPNNDGYAYLGIELVHRRLKRQLKRCFAAFEDDKDLEENLELHGDAFADKKAIMDFLSRVNSSYKQYERDVLLRSESLRISSSELISLNKQLNQETMQQAALIEAVRNALNRLLNGLGQEKINQGLMNAERITDVLNEVLEQFEAAHTELQYQKEALDYHAIVVRCDATGTVEYVNDNFTNISEYDKQELIGKKFVSTFPEEKEQREFQSILDKVAKGSVWNGELREYTKTGQEYWVMTTIVPLFSKSNALIKIIIIQTDLTPRKKIEQTLEKERQFLNTITDTMTEGVFTIDTDGKCTYFNKEAQNLLGYSRDEVMGKDLLSLIQAKDESGTKLSNKNHPLWQMYRTNQRYQSEAIIFTNKKGSEFYVALGTVPIRSAEADFGLVGVFQDITVRRHSERELARAKEIAEKTTQQKSDFIANLSHEIRTPLNAIIGLSHIALSNEQDVTQYRQLQKIHSSGKALLQVINDVLDFSKIEAGQLSLENISFNVDEIMENLSNIASVSAENKGIELFITKDPKMPNQLIGDPLRIHQILLNLTSNAIKFTEQGRVTVQFNYKVVDSTNMVLIVDVIDTGIGMNEEQLERVFLPYSQGDKSTTRRFGGSGLGLSISQHLAHFMNGEISAQSKPNKGSQFTLRIPTKCETRLISDRNSYPLSNKSVLLISDSTEDIRLISLRSFGLKVSKMPIGEFINNKEANTLNYDLYFVVAPKEGPKHSELLDSIETAVGNSPIVILSDQLNQTKIDCQSNSNPLIHVINPPLNSSKIWDVLITISEYKGLQTKALNNDLTSTQALKGHTILLVEDNEINQEVAEMMLKAKGASVIVANNGAEGIEKLAEYSEEIDLVLMDVQMPVMDGLTATRLIRENPKYSTLPIVALTAHVMKEIIDRGREAGITDHINKPIDPDELFSKLKMHLSKNRPDARLQLQDIQSTEKSKIDNVNEFNYEEALKRMGNNHALYAKLLKKFIAEYDSKSQRVLSLSEQSDTTALAKEIHNIKGVAGTIGATALFNVCKAFEEEIHQHHDLKRCSTVFSNTLAKSIEAARATLAMLDAPQNHPPKVNGQTNQSPNIDVLAQNSLAFLSQGNTKVFDLLDEWRDYLEGTEYQSIYNQLSEQVNNFDFLEAKTTVKNLIETLND